MSNKQLLIISIIILLSIIFWIASDIYHAATGTIITALQVEQVKPLTATFDGDIIEKIKSRER